MFDHFAVLFVTVSTTISNIRVSDKTRLPVHLIGMCLCQVILMVLTFNLHLEYIQLRRAFMKQRAREQTVLVTGIPSRMRSAVLVKSYFDVMYGGAVESAAPAFRRQERAGRAC